MGRAEVVITDAASTMPRVDNQIFRLPLRDRHNSDGSDVNLRVAAGSQMTSSR